jgi:hypothetical protein
LDIGQFLNDRVGVQGGDTNFNFLLPYLLGSEHEILFIDGRGLVTQFGRGGASAGLGFRLFDPELNRIFGLSGWVDYVQGQTDGFQQAGVSFESLGTWFDVRINGYIPFGRESHLVSSRIVAGSEAFRTINGVTVLSVLDRQLTESAYAGLDAEFGGPLPLLGRYGISGYVGGYWLDSDTDETAAGPRVRFEANVTDNFRVDVIASNDQVFGTNAWVNLNFSLPDGRPRQWFRPTAVEDRMLRTVNRSYRVQTNVRTDFVPTPVLGAAPGIPNFPQGGTPGQPIRAIFVDPDRLTNGDGTIENPFNTLQGFANVAANTLIIVDGSPTDRPVNGNLVLFDHQKLVSTSILAAGGVQLSTNYGIITVPNPSGFGDATPVSPIFTSPSGGVLVTLAGDNTEVAGFTFDGTPTNPGIPNAVAISGTNIVDFNIHHNTFRNYSDGVRLSNATGLGLFQANTLTGTPGVSNDGFRLSNSGVGTLDLFVNAYTPPAGSSLTAQANSFLGNDGAGINIIARNRAVINAHVVDNTIRNNGTGLILEAAATRSVINGSVVGNVIDGNRGEDRNGNGILDPGEDRDGDGVLGLGDGVRLIANASTLNLASLGEDTNANGRLDLSEDTNRNGVLDPTEDTNGNGLLDLGEDLNGNGILDPGEDTNNDGLLQPSEDRNRNGVLDLAEDVNGNGVLDPTEDINGNGRLDGGFIFAGNTITRNTGNGVAVNGINNSIINLTAIRNNLGDPLDHSTGNFGRGMSITGDSGIFTVNIGFLGNEDLNFNGVLDAGEDTNGNGVLDAANPLDGNNFIANRAGGLLVDLTGTAVGNITALNNTITGQGGGELTFQILGAGNGTAQPFTFSNTSQQGMNLSSLQWNLAPAALEFNTVGVGATAFGVANATDISTGLSTVNGTSNPFAVTDQATVLNLQFSDFQVLNGRLDAGEDLNANGVLDAGEDLPTRFEFNVGTSGAGGAPIAGIGTNYIGSQVTATFSSGQVLSGTMQALAGSLTDAVFVPTSNNSGSGPGVELRVSQAAVLNNPTFVGNNIQFHGGAGFVAQATEDGQINNLLLRNNTIQNNGSAANGGGISLRTDFAASAQINGSILNNLLADNIGPGLSAVANTGTINLTEIDNNTLDGNTTSVALTTQNGGTIATRVTNNTMRNSTSDGFVATADTGLITLNEFSGNTLDNAGGHGIVLSALNFGAIDIPTSEDFNGNGVLDAGEDANGNNLLDTGLRNNTLNNPVGNGLFVTGTNGTYSLGTVSGLSVNRTTSGVHGIAFDITNSTMTGRFVGNTLNGSVNNPNLGTGFSLTATNGSFDVTIGGPNASERNLIQNNRGAGIAIIAQNTAFGTFRIDNNLITSTVDDANASTPFSGQGIYVGTRTAGTLTPAMVSLSNSSILNNVIGDSANTVLGNAGGGVLVEIGQFSNLQGMTIDNNLIGSNGPVAPVTVPVATNNVTNGITFVRTGNSLLDNVVISNNQILNNSFDGVYLHAFGGANDSLDFTLFGNTIRGNAVNGLNFRTEADAQLSTVLTGNQILNNGFNGIVMTSFETATTDLQTQVGVWTKNTITGNAAHGIEISGTAGIPANSLTNSPAIPLIIGMNGFDPSDGLSLGNLISNNGMGGIEINAAGDLELNNNRITQNGANPTALGFTDANGTGGIDVNLIAGTDELRARVINNVIADNTGTGLEVLASAAGGASGPTVSLTVLGNLINANTQRGIDLLTRADSRINARIGDTQGGGNSITNNLLEGIYIVNTSSATQAQTGNALAANGTITVSPVTVVDIRGNSVAGNNNGGTFSAGGLVLRSGSSELFGPGGLTARVTENVFSGNLGDDVRIETFASTVTPATNAPIPQARIFQVFANNFGDTLSVNNVNSFYTINNVLIETSQLFLENGFNTTGFNNGQPGGSGEFQTPQPWIVVPVGTFSNNSFPPTLFP